MGGHEKQDIPEEKDGQVDETDAEAVKDGPTLKLCFLTFDGDYITTLLSLQPDATR